MGNIRPMFSRVLGIDLGLKRTGLAISDESGLCVRPLGTRPPAKSQAAEVELILSQCAELGVSAIVIGCPDSRSENPVAKRAKGLKIALETKIADLAHPILVQLEDESYTSKHAMERLIDSGVKKEKRKELLDSEVARILVERFIASESWQTR